LLPHDNGWLRFGPPRDALSTDMACYESPAFFAAAMAPH
jgi:hypothetical protein